MPVLVAPVQSTALSEPDRVHHGPDVVHRRLDRLHLAHTIREAGPALVEHQHAAARGKPFDVAHEERLLPGREQIAGDPAHEDEVRRACADDLIGDRDIAAARVAHFGRLHGRSVSDRRSALHGIAVDSSRRRAWSWLQFGRKVVRRSLCCAGLRTFRTHRLHLWLNRVVLRAGRSNVCSVGRLFSFPRAAPAHPPRARGR